MLQIRSANATLKLILRKILNLSPRNRDISYAVIASFASKVVTSLSTLVAVGLATKVLGSNVYGAWLATASFASILSFLDFGIPNAIINAVGSAKAKEDYARIRRLFSTGTITLFVSGSCIFLSFLIAHFFWPNVSLHIPNTENGDRLGETLAWMIAFSVCATPTLSVAGRVFVGYQKTYLTSICDLIGSLLYISLLIVFSIPPYHKHFFVATLISAPLFSLSLSTLLLITSRNIIDKNHSYSRYPGFCSESLRELLRTGRYFLLIQLIASASFSLDTFLVSVLVDLKSAAEIGTVLKLFAISSTLTNFLLYPLWPAFRDASVKGDAIWMRKTTQFAILSTSIVSLAVTTPLFLFGSYLISVWTSDSVAPSFEILLAGYLWSNILSIGNLIGYLLNGLGKLKLQIWLGGLMAIGNITLSSVLTLQFGSSGVIWGSILSYTAFVVVPISYLYTKKSIFQPSQA